MRQETSNVDSNPSPAGGGQPVWDEERAAWWLANADAREKPSNRSQMRCSIEPPCSRVSACSMSASALDPVPAKPGRGSAPTVR